MHSMRINSRVAAIPLSRTLALDARAKQLAAAGRDIINMTAGEPDFDSPEVVRHAAKRIVDEGRVRYTPAPGRLALRETIAGHLTRSRGVEFEAQQITVCHSAKHALSGSLISLVSPGDEVMLLLPAWVSYEQQVLYAGGVPVPVAPRADMGPDFDRLTAAITPNTRGLMLNSPNNPSGYVYTREEIEQLCDLAREHDLWILSDEIYSRLVYEGEEFASPVQCGDDARARTVLVDGASKSYSMTGYRIGYLAANAELSATVGRLHSQLTGAPNAISQDAFEAALVEEPPEVEVMSRDFDARRRHVLARLEELGLETPTPRGAFYVFPSIVSARADGDSDAFCEALLEDQGLATVPGTAFGLDGHIRLSYATSMEKIDAGLDRLASFLQS
jgi:aspartate aminotransferase